MAFDVILILDGTPQIKVQRCQIAAPRWPNNISSAAAKAIFKNRAENIDCSFDCVARRAILLKPNVANILLFNFCEQKFVQHGLITIAIDCNGLSVLIFEEKWPNYARGPIFAPNSDLFWMRRLFNVCVRVFCDPNAIIMQSLKTGRKISSIVSAVWHVVLLKPNVANILLLNFCEQKFVQYGSITIAIDYNCLALLVFEEKWLNYACGPKSAPNNDLAFQCMPAGFLCPKCNNFCLFTYPPRSKCASSVSRSHSAKRYSGVYTTIFVRRKDKTNYLSKQI